MEKTDYRLVTDIRGIREYIGGRISSPDSR